MNLSKYMYLGGIRHVSRQASRAWLRYFIDEVDRLMT